MVLHLSVGSFICSRCVEFHCVGKLEFIHSPTGGRLSSSFFLSPGNNMAANTRPSPLLLSNKVPPNLVAAARNVYFADAAAAWAGLVRRAQLFSACCPARWLRGRSLLTGTAEAASARHPGPSRAAVRSTARGSSMSPGLCCTTAARASGPDCERASRLLPRACRTQVPMASSRLE